MKIQIKLDEALRVLKDHIQEKFQINVDRIKIMYECEGRLSELYETINCFETEELKSKIIGEEEKE